MKADATAVQEELSVWGADGAVFTDPASVLYLTGYNDPADVGFPYVGLPAGVVIGEAEPVLLVPSACEEAAASTGVAFLLYEVYDYGRRVDLLGSFTAGLVEALELAGAAAGRLGYEPLRAPAPVTSLGRELVDVAGALDRLRAIKRPDEIEAIRSAARLSDSAHARIREIVEPGVSEIEVFAAARAAMEITAGERIQAAGDLIGNERAATVGEGQPTADRLHPGTTVIADIIPVLRGYFVDTCMAYAVGPPSRALVSQFGIVQHALATAVESVRPGLTTGELDSLVRGEVRKHGYDYDHHTGHGLGTTRWEEPFIFSEGTTELQPGMVVALEPGIYERDIGGVRIEDTLLVTEKGCEVLTQHVKTMTASTSDP
jgi:Xaa-Pro dipeptidase